MCVGAASDPKSTFSIRSRQLTAVGRPVQAVRQRLFELGCLATHLVP